MFLVIIILIQSIHSVNIVVAHIEYIIKPIICMFQRFVQTLHNVLYKQSKLETCFLTNDIWTYMLNINFVLYMRVSKASE